MSSSRFHLCTIFEAYMINSIRFSEVSIIFHILLFSVSYFSYKKRKPKIGEGNQKNSQFPNTLNFVYNFRRITACNPEALVISIVKDSGTKRGNKLFKL